MTVRIAIIGAGIMGADHARIIAEDVPGAILQVVCDADKARAQAVVSQLGTADIVTDPLTAIARDDVDAVILASPDPTHAPLSLACIRAGKPVLCEKPLSQKPAKCLEVVEAETAAGHHFVQLGFMRRYDQSYTEMKSALQSGALGRPLMMHNFHRNIETPASNFTGAMAITNSAPHEFDVVRYILETEFTAISAFQPKRSDARVAPVFMVLETAGGQLVNIEINNNAAYGYDVRGELVGELGSISLNAPEFSRLDHALAQSTAYAHDWRPRYADAYRRQNKAFVRFAKTREFPAIAANCWDGYTAALIAEAGTRALDSGQRVAVEMPPVPSFYR